MKIKSIVNVLGFLLVILGGVLLIPFSISAYLHEVSRLPFLISIGICLCTGLAAHFCTRGENGIGIKESFAIVTFGWLILTFFGALPFYISGKMGALSMGLTDCYFEVMSGFSTTGASILSNVESLPRGLLFWRSLTHWIGGMGIIVLTLAILPLIGAGGTWLFKAESPGSTISDKVTPRIKDTAKVLWVVYVLITGLEVILLKIGGMSLFDSFCHTFGTVGTGGFSTHNTSIAGFNVFIQIVIIVFMFISGANFALHLQALKGKPGGYLKNREFFFYCIIFLSFSICIAIDLVLRSGYPAGRALLNSVFQVVSIGTTTGFANDDFEQWSSFSRYLLFLLMFIGACGGSTGGGMKVMRIILLFKYALVRMRNLIHPQGVLRVWIRDVPVKEHVLDAVCGFFVLYILTFAIAAFILSFLGIDFQTALSASAACLGKIGPGLGAVGPMDNYGFLPAAAKWVLVLCMLVGRLEIYTVLLLFVPETWKR